MQDTDQERPSIRATHVDRAIRMARGIESNARVAYLVNEPSGPRQSDGGCWRAFFGDQSARFLYGDGPRVPIDRESKARARAIETAEVYLGGLTAWLPVPGYPGVLFPATTAIALRRLAG